jgi:hypothetical protein
VIELGHELDVTGFAVDPSSSCGDDTSSSVAKYTIETAAAVDGPWTPTQQGTFTRAQDDSLVPVAASATAVQYVRFTIRSNQTPHFATACGQGGGTYSGCHYTDLSELEVFGRPAA